MNPRGGTTARLVVLYAVLAAAAIAIVIVAAARGHGEHPMPVIAGGYDASAPRSCLGPLPKPVAGPPLPPTAPGVPKPAGPSFSLQQSGQFINLTNPRRTLGGALRMQRDHGVLRLTGTVDCVSGGSRRLAAIVTPGVKAAFTGTLGGTPVAAALKRPPPLPGAPLPRIPSGIAGTYTTSPTSTCLGARFDLEGSNPTLRLVSGGVPLGTVSYSSATGALGGGDIACVRGGHARLTATANDLLLQSMTVIPLDRATPTPAASASSKPVLSTPSGLSPAGEKFTATKQREDFNKLLAALFLSAAIVLVVARVFGIVAVRVGQPRVMGEIIAGIALGPSLLGAISPNLQAALFPSDVLPGLGVAANIGLIFYMFLVGLEVDQRQLKGQVARAAAISNASVIVPMLLGIAVALPLYKLIGPDKKFIAFAIFMGVTMSITAFPVLARILAERRMTGTPLGSLAIACAAIDDVTAWFLIALASTVATSGSFGVVVRTIGEAILFVLVMWFGVRRILQRMATAFDEVGRIPSGWLAAIFVGVLLAAYVTETINIAFIFGAFVMGMVMPRHARLTEAVTQRVEDLIITLLLPLFFVYTGLKTNITLLDRPVLWLITLGLVAVAIVGKLAGATVAARVSGLGWRESTVIGTLMNTRGLTELIVLNLALDIGAITSVLFAALVIMAIVTTLMAGPLLRLLDPKREYAKQVDKEFARAVGAAEAAAARSILAPPERAILIAPQTDEALGALVALGDPLARSEPPRQLLIARLVQPSRAVDAGARVGLQTENVRLERAQRAIEETRLRLAGAGVIARGVALSTSSFGSDLLDIIESEPVDLVVLEGRRRLIGDGTPLGEVGEVLDRAPCDVAVLIAGEEREVTVGPGRPVVIPFGGAEHDWAALELGSWLAASSQAPLKLLGAVRAGQTEDAIARLLADAALLVRQMTGVVAEPLLASGGRDGIVAAARGAGILIIGLSDRWRREGLGPTRAEIARAAPAPVLFVRRGSRPGVFAPRDSVTQFKWSMVAAVPSAPGPTPSEHA